MPFDRIIIFTDGACSGNPGKGGWGAIVVYPSGEVVELGGGARETTNNKMELVATIEALRKVQDAQFSIDLFTDSTYVIRGITQWIWGWRKRGWKNAEGEPVANRSLWEELSRAISKRQTNHAVEWRYVRGHAGIPGNERADEIAVEYSKGKKPRLYRGGLLQYDVPIHDLPEDTSLPEPKGRSAKKTKAYSYLSVVDGVLRRHKTWAECEAHVKGRSGARFKKATSPADEAEIAAQWGYSMNDLAGPL